MDKIPGIVPQSPHNTAQRQPQNRRIRKIEPDVKTQIIHHVFEGATSSPPPFIAKARTIQKISNYFIIRIFQYAYQYFFGTSSQKTLKNPDADKIYNQHLLYIAQITDYIKAINDEYHASVQPPAPVTADLAILAALKNNLHTNYKNSISNTNAHIQDFTSDNKAIMARSKTIYQDAITTRRLPFLSDNLTPDQKKIQQDLCAAQRLIAALSNTTASFATTNKDLTSLNDLIKECRQKLKALEGVLVSKTDPTTTLPLNDQQLAELADSFLADMAILTIQQMSDLTPPSKPKGTPRQDAIYSQYITYSTQIDTWIDLIDAKYPQAPQPAKVLADIAALNAIKTGALVNAYQSDYANANKTLQDFQFDSSSIMGKAERSYLDAMGNTPTPPTPIPPAPTLHARIEKDLTGAQSLIQTLTATIATFTQNIGDLKTLASTSNTQIKTLTTQVNSLQPGPKKAKALADLLTATTDLATLNTNITSATLSLSTLNGLLTACQTSLQQLQALADEANPTLADAQTADGILQTMATTTSNQQTIVQTAITTANTQGNKVTADITQVETDLQVNPLPPVGSKVESAVWYLDWTAWFPVGQKIPLPDFSNLPPGVIPTINLFVGYIALDDSGNPMVGGFGNLTTDPMINNFVAQCHANVPPINVKISLGGHGGDSQHDNCWDNLTAANVPNFAKALNDYCTIHNMQGIDFDYESFKGAAQETLVGQLIKGVKQLNPELMTSICTNAGFSTWVTDEQTIMDAAVDATTGKCAVDRLYIMSYFDPIANEEGWINQFAAWAKTRYGFNPSQITVGIDPSGGAYNPADLIKFAADNGYSTSIWDFDPAHPGAKRRGRRPPENPSVTPLPELGGNLKVAPKPSAPPQSPRGGEEDPS